MFALVPIIILAGGLSVGAFDETGFVDANTTNQYMVVEKAEIDMNVLEIAALEPFPYN